jgi:hypothetical protein
MCITTAYFKIILGQSKYYYVLKYNIKVGGVHPVAL